MKYQMNKNNKGFTLVETLVTCIIVVLLTGILTTLTSLAMKYFDSTVRDADAQVLVSTLTSAVQDELRYATDIQLDETGNLTSYFSVSSGLGANSKIISKEVTTNDGVTRNALVVNNGSNDYPLVNYGSYVYDINAYIDLKYANGIFEAKITAKDSKNNEICSNDFTVSLLNPLQ